MIIPAILQPLSKKLASSARFMLRLLELLADGIEKAVEYIASFFATSFVLILFFLIAACIIGFIASLFGIPWWAVVIILLLIAKKGYAE